MQLSLDTSKELAERAGLLNPRLKQLLSGKTLSVLERKGKLFVCTAHNKRFRALPIGHRKAKLVVEELLWLKMYGKRKHLFYLTKCDCGNKRILSVHSIIDAATSCGCIQREHDFLRTHGYTRTSIYRTWSLMKDRCLNPKTPAWKWYGGRGIKVCQRWLKFENFLEDMGPRPEGKTLERKDNNDGYHSRNCVWASRKDQARNRRSNNTYQYLGQQKSVAEISELCSIQAGTLLARLRDGWSVTMATSIPVRPQTNRRQWAKSYRRPFNNQWTI